MERVVSEFGHSRGLCAPECPCWGHSCNSAHRWARRRVDSVTVTDNETLQSRREQLTAEELLTEFKLYTSLASVLSWWCLGMKTSWFIIEEMVLWFKYVVLSPQTSSGFMQTDVEAQSRTVVSDLAARLPETDMTGTHVNVWQRVSCRIRLSHDELTGLSDTKFSLNQVRHSFPGPSPPTRTKSLSSAILSALTVRRECGWRERMSPWCFSFSLISNQICPFCLVSFLHLIGCQWFDCSRK